MSPSTKYNSLTVLAPFLGASFVVLAIKLEIVGLIAFAFIAPFVVRQLQKQIKCPRCGQALASSPNVILGARFYSQPVFCGEKCSRCGLDFV